MRIIPEMSDDLPGRVMPLPPPRRRPVGQHTSEPPGYPFEGRRGRRRRAMLAETAPEELPVSPEVARNLKERERQTLREHRDLLERLVASTAKLNSLPPMKVAEVLSSFLCAINQSLLHGRSVALPGFGCFVAKPTQPKPGRTGRVYIAFAACRHLAVHTSDWARYDPDEHRRWNAYRKNHRPSGRSWRRVSRTPIAAVRMGWQHVGRVAKRSGRCADI